MQMCNNYFFLLDVLDFSVLVNLSLFVCLFVFAGVCLIVLYYELNYNNNNDNNNIYKGLIFVNRSAVAHFHPDIAVSPVLSGLLL